MFLSAVIHGMSKREVARRFDDIVDFSGVERFLDTPMKRFSSGMYLRLAFAVAANIDSDVLLVDEVLAVGDAEFQRRCLGRMADVESSGRTIVFVSHNLGAVQRLCSEAVWLPRQGPGRDARSERRGHRSLPRCRCEEGGRDLAPSRGGDRHGRSRSVAILGADGRPSICFPGTSRSPSR